MTFRTYYLADNGENTGWFWVDVVDGDDGEPNGPFAMEWIAIEHAERDAWGRNALRHPTI